MAVSSEEFRSALARFASGVSVVTTRDAGGKLHGITVSAFCSVSLSPPLVLICIENAAGSHYAFNESGVFAVNILTEDQAELSEHFALIHEEKFAGIDFSFGRLGVPLLSGCLATLECRIRNTADGGDHTIFIGEVESAAVAENRPLVYFRGEYRKLK